MAANNASPLLYEIVPRKNYVKRATEITLLCLLISLLIYRLMHSENGGFTWFLAFLCESWFAFIWVLVINIKWNPVSYQTYPERLLQRTSDSDLPGVDMFVTTADPVLEPPIITVNTVLSLLAVDYPVNKLACFVSDDGCSPVTYYSLVEASKFAKLWVPFCKKYKVPIRAPFQYFSGGDTTLSSSDNVEVSSEFQQARKAMKDEYEKLSKKIEDATELQQIPCDYTGDFAAFSDIQRRNHPSIIKIVSENRKGADGEGLPHLIYISREKRPAHPHNYKAGAMNVLCRVSGLMTNAPFMLNVDCDMYANNPQIIQHAMCIFLGSKSESDCAYVQSPQVFYDGDKDDPFGNQYVVSNEYVGRGIVGIQGPIYSGTGCFHRRKVIYGAWPNDVGVDEKRNTASIFGKSSLEKVFGSSKELVGFAALALEGIGDLAWASNLCANLEAVYQVASCSYEYNTKWGKEVGWMYGSTTEDLLTGLSIHSKGWKSSYCTPDPPAFLGSAPSSGPTTMTQQKRWATGLLETLFIDKSPIIGTLWGHLQIRGCLAYLWMLFWALRSIPELLYALLPAYCLITNSNFLPNVPTILLPTAIFLTYNTYCISEYLSMGLSLRAWWNNQRMQRIYSTCAWTFGFLNVLLKLLGISEMVFEVTKKEQSISSDSKNIDLGRFTFDESPIFLPGTTLVFVHLTALSLALLKLQSSMHNNYGFGIGEVVCSMWILLSFLPFVKGLFRKGKYGIPWPTIYMSAVSATIFVSFCWLS